ncbi:MAG: hypothetical protein WBP16_10740 [Ferruginibacter sp.]
MKKYLILISLVLAAGYAQAQSLDDIRKLVILSQYDKARPEIDKYMADEKNAAKPEGWYYKAFVYNSLGRVATKPVTESKSLYQGAFDAIKKYAELDPKAPLTTEEKNSTVFNVYYGFFDLGSKTYGESNFTESYDLFKKALDVHDYIYNKNLTGYNDTKFSAHDTNVVWNLAVLANELKKKDEALVYYKQIADADLSEEKYVGAYDDLVIKYKREKNEELFNKYVTAAKKHYPVDKPYWEAQEIEFAINGLENEALFTKYDELTTRFPNSYMVFYNYGLELDRFIYSADAKGKDIAAYKKKMAELFKRAIELNSTIEANLQLGNLYYNSSFDYLDEVGKIKGTKPEDVKKKNELMALSKETVAKAIPYCEEAVRQLGLLTEYKTGEKVNYKLGLEILVNAYTKAGNTAKAAEYSKKKAEVEKL